MTVYTALVIKNNGDDIHCETGGQSKETGKWIGVVNLYKGEFFHTTLLSSNAVFNSKDESVTGMEKIVEQVRAMEL